MSIEQIRALKHAKPSRPFELLDRDGGIVKIERPLSIALAPNGLSVAGYDVRGRSFYLALAQLSDLRIARNKRVNRNGRR